MMPRAMVAVFFGSPIASITSFAISRTMAPMMTFSMSIFPPSWCLAYFPAD